MLWIKGSSECVEEINDLRPRVALEAFPGHALFLCLTRDPEGYVLVEGVVVCARQHVFSLLVVVELCNNSQGDLLDRAPVDQIQLGKIAEGLDVGEGECIIIP